MKEKMFIEKNIEKVQIEEFIRKEFEDGKIGEIELQRTPVGTRIIIHTMSPGYVIGSNGSKVMEITDKIIEQFGIKNPQIDVQKIENPDLNATIVSQNLAFGINDNINFKKLGNQALERIMRSGAIGCEIVFSGKISGARGRRERFMAGYLKKCGETSKRLVRTGTTVATPRLGNVSVRVKIMVNKLPPIIDASKLPDEKVEEVVKKKVKKKSVKKKEDKKVKKKTTEVKKVEKTKEKK